MGRGTQGDCEGVAEMALGELEGVRAEFGQRERQKRKSRKRTLTRQGTKPALHSSFVQDPASQALQKFLAGFQAIRQSYLASIYTSLSTSQFDSPSINSAG